MRVVVLTAKGPFGPGWVRAASTVADVVEVKAVGHVEWPAVDGLPFLACKPGGEPRYQIRQGASRATRLLTRLTVMGRRYERAFRHIQARHGKIDAVHAYTYQKARHLPRIRKRLGIPYVVSEQRTAFFRQPPARKISRWGVRLARKVYRDAAFVLPVTRSLQKAIEDVGLSANFRVVSNGIDTTRFQVSDPPPPTDEIRLLSIGRLSPVKGMDVLLQAIAAARSEEPRLRLTIVGSGPARPELGSLAQELALTDVVEFAGQQSHDWVADTMRSTHIFVLATRVDPLATVVVEAECCGVPVVATAVGGIPEHLRPEQGVLVPPEDATAFARGILEVASRLPSYDRQRLAEMARERSSFEAIGQKLAGVYAAAAAG